MAFSESRWSNEGMVFQIVLYVGENFVLKYFIPPHYYLFFKSPANGLAKISNVEGVGVATLRRLQLLVK